VCKDADSDPSVNDKASGVWFITTKLISFPPLHCLSMNRASISTDALLAVINRELGTLKECPGLQVVSIEVLTVPDKYGCNWRIGSFAGGWPLEPCRSLVAVAIWALQWRYNVVA